MDQKLYYSNFESFKSQILELRKANKLHTEVEGQLTSILKTVVPDMYPLAEPQGLVGGRNDLMLFEFSGRSIVFEIFATSNQVSRDLLILHKTSANLKVAIIIDEGIDPKVVKKFFHQNPDTPFPYIFISELYKEPLTDTYLKLQEIINGDEEARLKRILKAKFSPQNFINWCQIHNMHVLSIDEIDKGDFSYSKVFVTTLLLKLRTLGHSQGSLKKLGQWLSETKTLDYIFMKVDLGFNIYLYTDLKETFAAYSDMELVDWIRAGNLLSEPKILFPLTGFVFDMEDKLLENGERVLNPSREIKFTIGASQWHQTKTGRTVVSSLPGEVEAIYLLTPVRQNRPTEEYIDIVQISGPDSVINIGKKLEEDSEANLAS